MRHIDDDERRARLGRRHALATGVDSPEAATEALTVLHATEPATVFLSVWARVPGVTPSDVERALFEDRTLVKQLAMRRTLWVFPRDLLPAAWGSASARVAEFERRRMAKDVAKADATLDGDLDWLDEARRLVLAELDGAPDGLTVMELRARVPMIEQKFDVSAGSVWSAGRVMTHLGLTAHTTRGSNLGHWRTARYRWTLMGNWLGDRPEPLEEAAGYAAIVERWLRSFGPGTEDDLVWWLGATKAAVRRALADVGAEQVSLDPATAGSAVGWVHPDDVAEVGPPDAWTALLPVLDPTVMGWKARGWYLGPHGPALFDRNGNAGTTCWVDGRVVGCWTQDDDAVVRLSLFDDVAPAARASLEEQAARLTDWVEGVRIGTVYPSPAMKEGRG